VAVINAHAGIRLAEERTEEKESSKVVSTLSQSKVNSCLACILGHYGQTKPGNVHIPGTKEA
jgi:hypothetical protein